MVLLCFQFLRFPWEKYNMLRTNFRMLFLYNEFLLYISNVNGIEKSFICWQISNFDQFNNKNHLVQCNVFCKIKCNDKTINI